MKNFYTLTLVVAIFCTFASVAQNYQIGHKPVSYIDPSRSNRQIDTEIYYPAISAGSDQPFVAASEGQFPVLVFGHGFVMSWSAYQNIWENLVPQGFIMVFAKTEGGLAPSHEQFGKDLAYLIDKMAAENLVQSSFFYNKVAPLKAVMGHSMGGGAAYLAASQNSNISAILTLAPAETNPSAITAAGIINVPALILSGVNDCVTPPATNVVPMYNALQSSCKTAVNIVGGSHCQMAESNFFCGIGEGSCSPPPTITREVQHIIINNYTGKWLKNVLKADCTSGAAFDDLIVADNQITFVKNCLQCEDLSISNFSDNKYRVIPNPFVNEIIVELGSSPNREFTLYDVNGKVMIELTGIGKKAVSTENISSGLYFYTITERGYILQKGKLVKK